MKTKSNAPWILGLVGFCLSIPQVCCSILCATAAANVASAAADAAATTAELSADTTAAVQSAANDAVGIGITAMLPVVTTVICFVLGFFGKSKVSKTTGIVMILVALADVAACVVNFSILGIAAGVCFFSSGISSICNANKANA